MVRITQYLKIMEVQAQVLRIINKKSKKEQRRKNVTRKVFSRLEMLEGAKLIGAGAATIALAGAAVGIGCTFPLCTFYGSRFCFICWILLLGG